MKELYVTNPRVINVGTSAPGGRDASPDVVIIEGGWMSEVSMGSGDGVKLITHAGERRITVTGSLASLSATQVGKLFSINKLKIVEASMDVAELSEIV